MDHLKKKMSQLAIHKKRHGNHHNNKKENGNSNGTGGGDAMEELELSTISEDRQVGSLSLSLSLSFSLSLSVFLS